MKDDEFNALVRRFPAVRMIIILDSCRGGKLVEPMPEPGAKTKIAVITGPADGVDSKMVPERKDSVFSRALIDAIDGGAADLEAACEIAKVRTINDTDIIYPERKLRPRAKTCDIQIPQITDPWGICRSLRFFR